MEHRECYTYVLFLSFQGDVSSLEAVFTAQSSKPEKQTAIRGKRSHANKDLWGNSIVVEGINTKAKINHPAFKDVEGQREIIGYW